MVKGKPTGEHTHGQIEEAVEKYLPAEARSQLTKEVEGEPAVGCPLRLQLGEGPSEWICPCTQRFQSIFVYHNLGKNAIRGRR